MRESEMGFYVPLPVWSELTVHVFHTRVTLLCSNTEQSEFRCIRAVTKRHKPSQTSSIVCHPQRLQHSSKHHKPRKHLFRGFSWSKDRRGPLCALSASDGERETWWQHLECLSSHRVEKNSLDKLELRCCQSFDVNYNYINNSVVIAGFVFTVLDLRA